MWTMRTETLAEVRWCVLISFILLTTVTLNHLQQFEHLLTLVLLHFSASQSFTCWKLQIWTWTFSCQLKQNCLFYFCSWAVLKLQSDRSVSTVQFWLWTPLSPAAGLHSLIEEEKTSQQLNSVHLSAPQAVWSCPVTLFFFCLHVVHTQCSYWTHGGRSIKSQSTLLRSPLLYYMHIEAEHQHKRHTTHEPTGTLYLLFFWIWTEYFTESTSTHSSSVGEKLICHSHIFLSMRTQIQNVSIHDAVTQEIQAL